MIRPRSPFDNLPTRRRSFRVPVMLSLAVFAGLIAVQFGGSGPFFSFSPERDCTPVVPRDGHTLGDDPVAAVVGVSQSAFPCADDVTIAAVTDPAAIRTGAQRALDAGGPLLLAGSTLDPAVITEVQRLEPRRVTLVGLSDSVSDRLSSVATKVDRLAVDPNVLAPTLGASAKGPLFLLDRGIAQALPAVDVAAAATGGQVLVAEDVSLADLPDPMRLVIQQAAHLRLVGGFDPTTAWKIETVRSQAEIPGGGQLMFPGRRVVAYYGSPLTSSLGVLGEQGPAATAARMRADLVGYDADGSTVLPAFEIITTVASSTPGPDGDYSDELSMEALEPWLDYARDNQMYVLLDLQPGRSDFLSQAKRYEAALRLPYVGLALDPEWRLGPDQLPLQQIGSVDATEVNAVAEWLAGIVRSEVLPQKLFVVHQFKLSMINDRDQLVVPEELAYVIQMDGQGSQATKRATWDAVTAGTSKSGYRWGWKNFFDEDDPTATASQVLALRPDPVYVSFQ